MFLTLDRVIKFFKEFTKVFDIKIKVINERGFYYRYILRNRSNSEFNFIIKFFLRIKNRLEKDNCVFFSDFENKLGKNDEDIIMVLELLRMKKKMKLKELYILKIFQKF